MTTRPPIWSLLLALLVTGCATPTEPPPATFKGLIVFVSDRVVPWQLFAVYPDGSGLTQITFGDGYVERASQSPDGREIAYAEAGRLWTVSAGALKTEEISGNWGVIHPQWSPDGSRFALAAFLTTPTSQIYIYERGARGPNRLTGGAFSNAFPAWSPDGRYITFTNLNSSRFRLFRYEVGTGKLDTLAKNDVASHFTGVYSPSGDSIAFTRDGRPALMDADGSGVRVLGQSPGVYEIGSWSPDGTKLVVTFSTITSTIGVLDIATGALDTLLQDGHGDWAPLWIH